MKTLRQLLASKDRALVTVSPEVAVFDALRVMAEHDVGAVLVLQGEQLVGIFTERDYARKIILHGRASKETVVHEIMSDKVLYVTPEHSIDECMAIMTEKHFRHLPVMENSRVIGLVSIGDVVKETIQAQQFLIDQLERYITGSPATELATAPEES